MESWIMQYEWSKNGTKMAPNAAEREVEASIICNHNHKNVLNVGWY